MAKSVDERGEKEKKDIPSLNQELAKPVKVLHRSTGIAGWGGCLISCKKIAGRMRRYRVKGPLYYTDWSHETESFDLKGMRVPEGR
jgi:hypothetical protein